MRLAGCLDNLHRPTRELFQRTRWQVFFPELNKINSGASGAPHAIKHGRALLGFIARKLLPISYVVENQDVSGGSCG